jgi:hypothetical protein
MKWTCPKCDMIMIKRKFKKHMETVHNEKDIKVFQCKCQYQTFSKEALDKHVESCTTINRQICTRPGVFVNLIWGAAYLLILTCFYLTNFLEMKNSAHCLLKPK